MFTKIYWTVLYYPMLTMLTWTHHAYFVIEERRFLVLMRTAVAGGPTAHYNGQYHYQGCRRGARAEAHLYTPVAEQRYIIHVAWQSTSLGGATKVIEPLLVHTPLRHPESHARLYSTAPVPVRAPVSEQEPAPVQATGTGAGTSKSTLLRHIDETPRATSIPYIF